MAVCSFDSHMATLFTLKRILGKNKNTKVMQVLKFYQTVYLIYLSGRFERQQKNQNLHLQALLTKLNTGEYLTTCPY